MPGAADVKLEQVDGPAGNDGSARRRQALARYGLTVADVQDVVSIAIGGREAGQVFEGDRRFDIIVRLPEELRRSREVLEQLPVPLPAGDGGAAQFSLALHAGEPGYIALGEVADIDLAEGPNQISRENGKRRIVVQANVRGRDLGSLRRRGRSSSSQRRSCCPPGTGWTGAGSSRTCSPPASAWRSWCRSASC